MPKFTVLYRGKFLAMHDLVMLITILTLKRNNKGKIQTNNQIVKPLRMIFKAKNLLFSLKPNENINMNA